MRQTSLPPMRLAQHELALCGQGEGQRHLRGVRVSHVQGAPHLLVFRHVVPKTSFRCVNECKLL